MRKEALTQMLATISYSLSLRGIGKTTLLKKGADGYPDNFLLITRTLAQANKITTNPKCMPLPLDSLERIRGNRYPILIDHEALLYIVSQVQYRISDLEEEASAQEKERLALQKDFADLEMACLNYFMTIPWWKFRARRKAESKILELLINYYQKTSSHDRSNI